MLRSERDKRTFNYPPGYVTGYELSLSNNLVTIDPGVAAIGKSPVFMLEQYTIQPEDWQVGRVASTDFYVYLIDDGSFEIHSLSPSFSEHVMNKSHPALVSMYLGKITTASDKSIASVTQRSS